MNCKSNKETTQKNARKLCKAYAKEKKKIHDNKISLFKKNFPMKGPKNEDIPNLRHEDTLFSYHLKLKNIKLLQALANDKREEKDLRKPKDARRRSL